MTGFLKRASFPCALALAAFADAPTLAQTAEPFFKGRVVNVYIGFGGGGSYDFYARLIARHMGAHIHGNPTLVAQAMPGAGSFKLANWLSAVAPKDGTAFGIVSQSIALEEALSSPGVQYKSAEFNWIGRATSVVEVMMTWMDAKAKTIGDAVRGEVMIGGTGPGSPSEGYPKLLNAAAHTKFKIITGYPSSSEVMLAMEKGEVDAAYTSWGSLGAFHQNWLRDGTVNILVQGTVARSADLPDTPAVGELGDTPEDQAMLRLYASTADIGRAFIAPPGVPADRVAQLRAAFDATMVDPDFIAEVANAKAEFHPLPGADLQRLIVSSAHAPPALIGRMKELLATVSR